MAPYIMKTPLTALAALSILGCFATGCSASGGEDVASGEDHIEGRTLVYKQDQATKLEPVGGREGDRLLLKLFAQGYRGSYEECSVQSAEARIVPKVSGKLSGSFTGTYRRETLYVISVEGCDASHAEGYGTTRFVVTDPAVTTDVAVLANVEEPGVGAGVNRIVDLDQNGQNEIVLTNGWSGQGYTMEHAELVRFAGNTLARDAAFAAYAARLREGSNAESPFYEDSCGTGNADAKIAFANVYATSSGGNLSFSEQRGTLTCPPEDQL